LRVSGKASTIGGTLEEGASHMRRAMYRLMAAGVLAANGIGAAAFAQHAGSADDEDGASVYASACVECHGENGNLIAGIDLGRGQFRRPFTDNELASLIMNGIPGTTMVASELDEEQIESVVTFLRDNARPREEPRLAGDAVRGEALFEGKGECLDCHRIDGVGSRVGPDLSRIGRVRRAGDLMRSLLDPAAEVQPNNRFYRVVTNAGEEVTGRLLNHDTFTVLLIDLDERLRRFDKADLREQGFEGSPMPSYRDTLSEQEIADLVSYLGAQRGS
jgi:putative heme-binding domain-containing protein